MKHIRNTKKINFQSKFSPFIGNFTKSVFQNYRKFWNIKFLEQPPPNIWKTSTPVLPSCRNTLTRQDCHRQKKCLAYSFCSHWWKQLKKLSTIFRQFLPAQMKEIALTDKKWALKIRGFLLIEWAPIRL